MSSAIKFVPLCRSLYSVARLFPRLERHLSHNTALITKVHRETYVRKYPVTVIDSDGSSYLIRYHEPRLILKLPLDVASLSEEERQRRLERRNPKQKVVVAKEDTDNFNTSKYVNLVKRKR